MKGILFSCYGCGGSNCSMCAVGESSSEYAAIQDYIRMFGLDRFVKFANSKGFLVKGQVGNISITKMRYVALS